MELFYRRPSAETRKVMSNVALNLKHMPGNKYEEIIHAEECIRDMSGHEHARVVNSGNSAILSVMSTFTNEIMIPDQGGWVGFKKMAKFLGLKVSEIPTILGVVDIEVLEEMIHKINPEAFFITSFAGYMAEQPINEIYNICEDMGVVLVEDASGSIGDSTGKMCNGDHAHVIVASTGSPKTVNVGNGGFVSTNDAEIISSSRDILKTLQADPVTCAGISSEIGNAGRIFSKTVESCNILKRELNKFRTVFHSNKRGLNVAIPDNNPKKFGYQLRNQLDVVGGGIITVCPRYDRIKSKAVCIEIKNLDINCMIPENIENILQILKNHYDKSDLP